MLISSSDTATASWRLTRLDEVGSTNDFAGTLPGWNAVVAKTQNKGRGRYRRTWISDEGGIWLSAVLPTPGHPENWGVLPLAAGWALRETMIGLGIKETRLRWPNDLMIAKAKLAGILVERFNPSTAVVGIGINYDNAPATLQPELTGLVTRMADLLDPLPSRDEVIITLLTHLAVAQRRIEDGKVSEFLPALNQAWQMERVTVTLQLPHHSFIGAFVGVDARGNLLVKSEEGKEFSLLPTDVELLREIQ